MPCDIDTTPLPHAKLGLLRCPWMENKFYGSSPIPLQSREADCNAFICHTSGKQETEYVITRPDIHRRCMCTVTMSEKKKSVSGQCVYTQVSFEVFSHIIKRLRRNADISYAGKRRDDIKYKRNHVHVLMP